MFFFSVKVRQKSKEIAAQVRDSVRNEEKRQIELLNRIKHDEMLTWRQKQMGVIEKNFEKCLEQIGEAHVNAARENAKEQFEKQKEKNRKIALQRGKIAAQKLNKKKQNMKLTKPTCKMKEKQILTISKKVDSSPESVSDTSTSSSSSSDSSVSPVISVENKKKPDEKVIKSNTTFSPKKPLSTKFKSPGRSLEYNSARYESANSTVTDVSFNDSPMSDPPPFITKVSELLGLKPLKATSLRSSPHIAKTYKLNKSPVTMRSPINRKTNQKPQINTVSTRLSRVIKTPSKTQSGKSPSKVLPEKKHFVPEFAKCKSSTISKSNSSVQTTPHRLSRVEFYDHANKFSKQYYGCVDLIESVEKVTSLDAWDEAQFEEAKKNDLLMRFVFHIENFIKLC